MRIGIGLIGILLPMTIAANECIQQDFSHFITRVNPAVITPQAKSYSDLVNKYSTQYKLDARLVVSLIAVESSFNSKALGTSGELGLMQLHPKFHGRVPDNEANIRTGIIYLKSIEKQYRARYGSLRWVELYNRGPNSKPVSFPYYKRVMRYYVSLGGRDAKEWGKGEARVGRDYARRSIASREKAWKL